jgi:hypothetical protein
MAVGGRRQLMALALGVSLAVNLAVAGLFAGTVWRGEGHRRDPPPPSVTSYALPYLRALPKETRRAHFETLRAGPAGPALDRAARRAPYDDMLGVLRSEPFDRDAALAVLARQGTAAVTVQDAAQAVWLEEVTEMDAPARAAYADRLEEVLAAARDYGRRKKD